MKDFLMQNGGCIFLVGAGLFFIVISFMAEKAGRSGGWFLGGMLISFGFLTTPHRWLALLGFLDPGYWKLAYALISDFLIKPNTEKNRRQ